MRMFGSEALFRDRRDAMTCVAEDLAMPSGRHLW